MSKEPVQYLYLDDESTDDVKAYIDELEESSKYKLKINPQHPKPYQIQIAELKQVAGSLPGLMLDLRLDQYYKDEKKKRAANVNAEREDEDQADYRAATIAQEIRTRATECLNDDKNPRSEYEFPIVLCSTNERLRRSYISDDTSHDLFDIKFVKTDLKEEFYAVEIAKKMVSLVSGYDHIKEIRREKGTELFHYLGGDAIQGLLDIKVIRLFSGREAKTPAHEFVRFVIRELLDIAGPLIDRATVAARLGVDISKGKSAEFDLLLDKYFSTAAYSGIFSDGWPRWWAAVIEDNWRKLGENPISLRTSTSEQRVDYLKKITNIEGIEAIRIDEGSQAFWVVCYVTQRPLDPKDGYLLNEQPTYTWQDRFYISRYARHEGILTQKKMVLSPSEESRFKRNNTNE